MEVLLKAAGIILEPLLQVSPLVSAVLSHEPHHLRIKTSQSGLRRAADLTDFPWEYSLEVVQSKTK